MAGRRLYHVKFEGREGKKDEWQKNWSDRTVIVKGGADEAARVAAERESRRYPDYEIRATDVTFVAEETDD